MRYLTSMMGWLLLGASLAVTGVQGGKSSPATLEGAWTATKAERDGKSATDVVGHRLTLTGNHFEIRSKDGRTLVYAGTFEAKQSMKAATIDFVNTEGQDKGKTWRGIFALGKDSLTICDNAPDVSKARPTAFEAKQGSGYVLLTFARAHP